jgi:hypothetical protein
MAFTITLHPSRTILFRIKNLYFHDLIKFEIEKVYVYNLIYLATNLA